MILYFISGLGADWRAFEKLKLKSNFEIKYIDWLMPEKGESVQNYSYRISSQIDNTLSFSLIGLSFGGIIANEISLITKPENTIIISSFTPGRIPRIMRFFRYTKLHYIIPYKLIKKPNKVTYKIFGAQSDDDKKLLDIILREADIKFLKWAMRKMMYYKADDKTFDFYHIHGSCDKIIPLKYVSPDFIVENGTHFMVYNQAGIISKKINDILK